MNLGFETEAKSNSEMAYWSKTDMEQQFHSSVNEDQRKKSVIWNNISDFFSTIGLNELQVNYFN